MKISLNKQILSSRLPSCLPKFIHREEKNEQIADIIVRKDRKTYWSVVYLPMDYHRLNPGYLAYKLEEVEKEQRKLEGNSKTLVVVLL
jgi:hypothetical protein